MKSKLMKILLVATILFTTLAWNIGAVEAAVHYETRNREIIGKGITYEIINRVTTRGLLDIHILKAPLDDPFISLGVAKSQTEFELKERTTALLQQTGAVAGINGDFFDLTGSYSAAVGSGLEVSDGKLLSANIYANTGTSRYGTFFIDNAGNPFINYLTTSMQFLVNSSPIIRVTAVNKVTGRDGSAYLDRNAVLNTRLLDERFPDRVKIIVENNMVTRVSRPGENVSVPENGFVIFLSEADAEKAMGITIGANAAFNVSTSIDHKAMNFAISGGGKLLENGATIADSGFVPTGNQPRTAVGFSANGKEVIMMVVDGRSHSVGVSHNELADLMRANGAVNAMHLDGGGSSAMAVRSPGQSEAVRVNTPSDGAERRVANALGIYMNAPAGVMTQLAVKPRNNRVFLGTGLPVSIYGNDAYFNTLSLTPNEISVGFNDEGAKLTDGFFFPSRAGSITIEASYNGVSGKAEIRSMELAALVPALREIQTGISEEVTLEFNGLSINGETAYIYSGLKYEVHPETLGRMEGDVFIAEAMGAGYIKCSVGDVVTYIGVNSGNETRGIFNFNDNRPMRFIGHPTDVTGSVRYSQEQVSSNGSALEFNYTFTEGNHTQAAYASFDTPLPLAGNPNKLRLMVYGNNSSHWLRARLIDADDNFVIVDFARNIDWDGWRQVEASLPNNIKYPVRLDRIYVAALENKEASLQTLYFDDLSGDIAIEFEPVSRPNNTIFLDRFRSTSLAGKASANGVFQISVSGNLGYKTDSAPRGHNDVMRQITDRLNQNSSYALHSGNSEIGRNISVKNAAYSSGYNFTLHNNVGIMQLTAEKGGLMTTDVTQWAKFTKDLKETNAQHIIIYIDRHPFNFNVNREYAMFQEVLAETVDSGKNVFVVYEGASALSLNVREGVRYLGLTNLWNEDGSRHTGYRTLRFEIAGNSILYDFI